MAVIQTNNLSKVYTSGRQHITALDNLNLSVEKGEIFGYLGPNGAGKTTTIRLLLDLIRPTEGSATVFDMDIRNQSVAIHERVGFLPGELNLWKNRHAMQVINYMAKVRGMNGTQRAQSLADRLKLDLSRRIREYSSGNRRKLGIVLAMMHEPDLLILDEPTSGLDPLMQQTFNQMMRELRDAGKTVFLSSHVLSEVQAICDRVGILRDGELQAIETVERLTHVDFRWIEFIFRETVTADTVAQVSQIEGTSSISHDGQKLRLQLQGDFDPVLRAVEDLYVQDIRIEEPTLEEIFLAFYGGEASVVEAVS